MRLKASRGIKLKGSSLRAIMTDLEPAIPVAELELAPNGHPSGIIECMIRASNHAVKFLRDYADPTVDVNSAGYLASSEETWSEDLEYLHSQSTDGLSRVKHGWAEMRLHWWVDLQAYGLSTSCCRLIACQELR